MTSQFGSGKKLSKKTYKTLPSLWGYISAENSAGSKSRRRFVVLFVEYLRRNWVKTDRRRNKNIRLFGFRPLKLERESVRRLKSADTRHRGRQRNTFVVCLGSAPWTSRRRPQRSPDTIPLDPIDTSVGLPRGYALNGNGFQEKIK